MSDPNKEVKLIVYDQEEADFVEMTMDEDDYKAMVEYEQQLEFEEYERRQRLKREDY